VVSFHSSKAFSSFGGIGILCFKNGAAYNPTVETSCGTQRGFLTCDKDTCFLEMSIRHASVAWKLAATNSSSERLLIRYMVNTIRKLLLVQDSDLEKSVEIFDPSCELIGLHESR
jgi:hypothetical protein